MVILAWKAGMMQTSSNEVKIYFQVNCYHESQCRPPCETICTLTKVVCTSGPNLVTLDWMGDELSWRQARDWYTQTDRYTDSFNDIAGRPKPASGKKNGPSPWGYKYNLAHRFRLQLIPNDGRFHMEAPKRNVWEMCLGMNYTMQNTDNGFSTVPMSLKCSHE